MIKTIFIAVLLAVSSQAVQIKCKGCSAGKDMSRCDYYVVKKHDLSHQGNCLTYAKYIDIDGMHAKAAWYYLLGGDRDNAKKNAIKAIKQGHHYAAEYEGFVYLLDDNQKKAQKTLTFFKKRVKNIDYVKKDIDTIKSIYKNFNDKSAYKILF